MCRRRRLDDLDGLLVGLSRRAWQIAGEPDRNTRLVSLLVTTSRNAGC